MAGPDAVTPRQSGLTSRGRGYYPWLVEQLAIADRCIRCHADEEKTPFEGYEGLLKYLEPPVADKGEKVTDKPAGETGMGTTPKVEPKLEPMFEVSLPPRPVGAKADCVMLTPRTSRRGRARHRRR